jgi:hypothetical protein
MSKVRQVAAQLVIFSREGADATVIPHLPGKDDVAPGGAPVSVAVMQIEIPHGAAFGGETLKALLGAFTDAALRPKTVEINPPAASRECVASSRREVALTAELHRPVASTRRSAGNDRVFFVDNPVPWKRAGSHAFLAWSTALAT